jgi:hypothetical protein
MPLPRSLVHTYIIRPVLLTLQAGAERRFQEWLQGEEGRQRQQQHASRLQELQSQTEQLQRGGAGGGGGELFPQVAIDRNNELARLVRKLY